MVIKRIFSRFKGKTNKKPIIFDVGANVGSSIKRFDLIFNDSVIHSFEPIKECFDQMVRDYPNKRFLKNNYALGEKNTNKRFFINKHTVTSSFFRINKSYDETDKNDKPKNNIKIKTITLDTYINLNKIKKIDILKIDTQGFELNILKGAKKSLKKVIHFVEVEIIICDYYEKKINLHEIDSIMCKNNFDLFNLQNVSYNKDSQIKWFDMLYINRKFK
jgi:FkbM family methyltransferase